MLPRPRVHLGALIEDPVHCRAADSTGFGDCIDGNGKLHPLAQVMDRIASGEAEKPTTQILNPDLIEAGRIRGIWRAK